MSPEKIEFINGHKVEQFHWNDKLVVYIDNKRFDGDFISACARLREEAEELISKQILGV